MLCLALLIKIIFLNIKTKKIDKNNLILFFIIIFSLFFATFFTWLLPWYFTVLISLLIVYLGTIKKFEYNYLIYGITMYGIAFHLVLR